MIGVCEPNIGYFIVTIALKWIIYVQTTGDLLNTMKSLHR